jgi:beta-N-acetylhexosaminidase
LSRRIVALMTILAALPLAACGNRAPAVASQPSVSAASTSEPSSTGTPPTTVSTTTPAPTVSPAARRRTAIARLRPTIVQRPIPFGPRRKAEMAAYSLRHYGRASWRLTHPSVIVEHYTVTATLAVAYDLFATDVPDAELQELPGTCAHFLIDRDGTIVQLVPLAIRCRHTVGLNDAAIGIEHVGLRDADVLDRPAVLRASLRLTRWLRCRFAIGVRDVIGHAESLTSPKHHERAARLRTQTHADMQPAAMRRYRALIARRPCPAS